MVLLKSYNLIYYQLNFQMDRTLFFCLLSPQHCLPLCPHNKEDDLLNFQLLEFRKVVRCIEYSG